MTSYFYTFNQKKYLLQTVCTPCSFINHLRNTRTNTNTNLHSIIAYTEISQYDIHFQ